VHAAAIVLALLVAKPGQSQTPALQADGEDVLRVLRSSGVANRDALVAALELAREAEPEDEFACLRRLGVTLPGSLRALYPVT
jgi:hypothetical protein